MRITRQFRFLLAIVLGAGPVWGAAACASGGSNAANRVTSVEEARPESLEKFEALERGIERAKFERRQLEAMMDGRLRELDRNGSGSGDRSHRESGFNPQR